METGLKVNTGEMSVEWKIGDLTRYDYSRQSPDFSGYDYSLRSPDFTVAYTTCYFKARSCKSSGCKLKLHLNVKPSSPFLITTYISKGADIFLPQVTTADTKENVIWACKELNKLKEYLCFRTCYFRIFFHTVRDIKLEKGAEFKLTSGYSSSLNSLSHDLLQLLEDTSDHDVKLRCEGQVLSAHRNFLSARSEVFKTMFQTNMREKTTGIVDIQDMALPLLKLFLKYLYTGMLPDLTLMKVPVKPIKQSDKKSEFSPPGLRAFSIGPYSLTDFLEEEPPSPCDELKSHELAAQLYEAGAKYAVGTLKKDVTEFFKTCMKDDNVCKILLLADLHDDQDLKEYALRYITSEEVPKKWKGWSEFSASNQKLGFEVLTYYALNK